MTATKPAADFYVEPFPGRKGSERVFEPCGKCSGSGVVSWGNVTFVSQGREDRHCFDCGGSGKTSRLVSSARATARRRAQEAARMVAEAEAAAETRREWIHKGYGELLEAVELTLTNLRDGDPLRREALEARERINRYAATEADAEAVHSVLDAVQAREAAKRPVPEGRVEIEGAVLATKWQESDFGGSLKMLVEGEGFKVWGSVPSTLGPIESGDRVAFTATVEASADDKSFGFFKRPTKARRLDG